MSYSLHTALFYLFVSICLTARAAEPTSLQVLLQGSSSSKIAELVVQAGGTVTHDLHVIDAVGARLSQEQLDEVLKSSLISRHIDDLSDTDRPDAEPESDEACKVRGHIEVDLTLEGIQWGLYNKRADPASLERLEIEWPDELGPVTAIFVGDKAVDPALIPNATTGALTLHFPPSNRPVVTERLDLKINFESWARQSVAGGVRQSDFMLEASFTGGCSTDLVPGYENNHGDFYYNTVAGIDALHRQGITGKGVTVAVIDSGLWEHDALMNDTSGKPRVFARYDALTDVAGSEVVDESGHGTHMTSIIANSAQTTKDGRPTGTYKGAAPDAGLVAVKVLDREGFAHVLEIVRAIQWVVDHREEFNIRVLNLSFAQKPRWPFWLDPVDQAAMKAWLEGIAVVAAAGNDGPGVETIGSPGNLPYIITVGAVTDSWTPGTRDDDYVPDFSSRGPTPSGHVKPDVVALGGHMTGLIHPDSAIALEQPEDMLRTGEFVSTGSSQAAALVSGMLALLIQLEPDLTPDDLKCKLVSSAEPAINKDGTLAYSPFQQGYGYVTATRAVMLGERGCGNLEFEQPVDLSNERNYYGPAVVAEDGTASLPGLDTMLSSTPSEKGLSDTRKWGVKDHIERLGETSSSGPAMDWFELYQQERTIIDKLSRHNPDRAQPTP